MFEELGWFLLAIILATVIFNHFSAAKNLPPGPFPLPIIGNAHQLSAESRHLDFWAIEKQYGHVFRLYVGSQLVIVVSGVEAVKEVLVTKSVEFGGRPSNNTVDIFSHKGKAISFADYSLEWRLLRKVAVSALKMYTSGALTQVPGVNDESRLLLERLHSTNGQPHDLTKEIRLAVMNVVCALVFGWRYELDDPEFLRFDKITKEIFAMIGTGSVADVFPWLRFLPLKSIRIFKQNCKEREDIVGRIYREHVKANRVQNPQDLTDALLKAKKEAEEEDSSNKGFLTDERLILTMGEVFMAGMETTAVSLCWTLLRLIHNPKIQQKLHDELDRVVGPNRLPDLEDRKSLPYLEATITEALRISSVGPVAMHKTTVDTSLQGYHIPKSTTVLINLWSLHHDPEIWEYPNDFRPQRFLDEDGYFLPPKADRYCPFSAGRRGCFGEPLARIEVFLFLARLLHTFKFENPQGCDLPTLEPISGLVLQPQPFKVCVVKRN